MNNRNIKIKKKSIKPIKKLDRYQIYTKKLKNNFVNIKDKSNYNSNEENSPTQYGEDKITENVNIIFRNSTNTFNDYGKKSLNYTRKNILQTKDKIVEFRTRIKNKTLKTRTNKTTSHKIKNDKKAIKTTNFSGLKIQKKMKESLISKRKKAYQIAKATAKKTAEGIKKLTKAMISAVKMIIQATSALIAFLIAGGWIAALIIIVITLIALLCGSIFGIFFSSESNFR